MLCVKLTRFSSRVSMTSTDNGMTIYTKFGREIIVANIRLNNLTPNSQRFMLTVLCLAATLGLRAETQ